jgi:4'-phosphopantetheinyl transferase
MASFDPTPLSSPSFAEAGVQLWLVDLDQPADVSVLSPDEAERAGRFKFERDAARYRHCRAALRRLLSARLGPGATALVFDVGAHGKPRCGSH